MPELLRRHRLAVLAVLIAGVALAAVFALRRDSGKDDGPSTTSVADGLAEALAFVPDDAAAVAVIQTDVSRPPVKALRALIQRIPLGTLAAGPARDLLVDQLGLALDPDANSLLGIPVVAWQPRGRAITSTPSAAWVATDADALGKLVDARVRSGRLKAAGEQDGARLYVAAGGTATARRDATFLLAPDLETLKANLRRGEVKPSAWTPDRLEQGLRGLPAEALVRAVVAEASLVTAQLPAILRGTPYVRAHRGFGLTLTADEDGLQVELRGRTDPRQLREEDLPLDAGAQSPPLHPGQAPVAVALRDPRRTVAWAREAIGSVGRTVDRLGGPLGRYAGVDLTADVFEQLTGPATVTLDDQGRATLRAQLSDAGRVQDALDRVRDVARLGPLASAVGVDLGGLGFDERDGRFRLRRGDETLAVVAVRDGLLIASQDPDVDVDAVARRPPAPGLPEARGAGRAYLTAARLQAELRSRLGLPDLVAPLLSSVGSGSATLRTELDGLQASARIRIR